MRANLIAALDIGTTKTCAVICDLDGRAIKQAFPDMPGQVLCRQADGACVCAFKYERKAR